jgi:hypothetical protein
VTANRIAAVDAKTGAIKTGFARNAIGAVQTVQYTHGQVLVGGRFLAINGTARNRLASLNPTTGAVTPYLNLSLTGAYPNSGSQVYNSQLSHAGSRLLIEGVFTSIAGKGRQQIAMLNLGASSATLNSWYSSEFNRACSIGFYTRDAAWSPDDATIYVATTGYKPVTGTGSSREDPRGGLCDAAAAFPATGTAVAHTWINYTGCDSYYAVVADINEVYVGGHERWANNPNGCDVAGPGAVSRPGIAALHVSTGQATSWNPTRSLGHGVDDMVLTNTGLWAASDTWKDGLAQRCGGKPRHGGLCYFPY